jgi:NAD-dependent DNA ligase
MTKTHLQLFNELRGTTYANCRTAIVGLFGSSDGYKYRDLITLVPLAIDRKDVPEVKDRIEEIELCNRLYRSHGEPLRYMYIKGNVAQLLYFIKQFTEEAFAFREFVDFMFDGIVVSYLDENIRSKLGRENYINKYSMAIKFNPLSKLTEFTGYTYEVGQDGRICPMIHYQPVEFFGTIHTKSTGSGLSRFNDLHLKVGDFIKVTYVNDVMPYVTAVDCDHNRNNPNPYCEFPTVCPVCGSPLQISNTGKTATCPNMDCNARTVTRMANMLQKMNIKGFADSTIISLGVSHFYELMNLKYDSVVDLIGPTNTMNFVDALDKIRNGNIPDYILVGALGFTGTASQTWKLIFSNMTLKDFVKDINNNPTELAFRLSKIPGIGPSTVDTILNEYSYYEKDIGYILNYTNYSNTIDSIGNSKAQIRFTGCRNLQLQEQLSKLGYDIDGNASVTKKTDILLVPYKGFHSSKVSKVSENCKIVPITEFQSNLDQYL